MNTQAIAHDVSPASASKPAKRYGIIAARVVLGLAFFVFGLNGFLNFLPQPPADSIPAGAAALGGAMMKSGYLMQFVKGTEVLCGVLLLANRFVPLALVILAPVMLNILAFHAFLAPSGLAIPVVLLALHLTLAWTHRNVYAPLFHAKNG